MAISFTEVLSGNSTTAQQVYSTATTAIIANDLFLLGVASFCDQPATAGSVSVSGLGGGWTLVNSALSTPDVMGLRLSLFYKLGTGFTSGVVTMTVAGTGNQGCGWVIVKVTGISTAGDALVQNGTGYFDGVGLTVPLAPFGNSANATCGVWSNRSVTVTPEAGYLSTTQITLGYGSSGYNAGGLRMTSLVGVDTTPSITGGGGDKVGVAVELKNATPAVPTPIGRSQGFIA